MFGVSARQASLYMLHRIEVVNTSCDHSVEEPVRARRRMILRDGKDCLSSLTRLLLSLDCAGIEQNTMCQPIVL